MTALFLMRHTQTVWNVDERYQGVVDSPLSGQGMTDIDRIVECVRPGLFESVYSTPLSRGLILAEQIARKAGVPITVDERLIEINLGPWQGLKREEIEQQFPELFHAWYHEPEKVCFPEGESLDHVAERFWAFVEERFDDPHCGRAAVISHDTVIKLGIMQSLGLPFHHLHAFRLRNGSISILQGKSPYSAVESVDNVSHLTGSPFVVV